jgi:excisionase family DNA binding protein
MSETLLLTVPEAAAELRVSRSTLESMIQAGTIATVRLPGTLAVKRPPLRITRDTLREFVRSLQV